MFGRYSSESQFEFIRNNKIVRIPTTWEILQTVENNRIMLITLMRRSGMIKDEILKTMKNPEDDIKEIIFEFNFGPQTEKKYCPKCKELMFPIKIKKNKIIYSCQICKKEY